MFSVDEQMVTPNGGDAAAVGAPPPPAALMWPPVELPQSEDFDIPSATPNNVASTEKRKLECPCAPGKPGLLLPVDELAQSPSGPCGVDVLMGPSPTTAALGAGRLNFFSLDGLNWPSSTSSAGDSASLASFAAGVRSGLATPVDAATTAYRRATCPNAPARQEGGRFPSIASSGQTSPLLSPTGALTHGSVMPAQLFNGPGSSPCFETGLMDDACFLSIGDLSSVVFEGASNAPMTTDHEAFAHPQPQRPRLDIDFSSQSREGTPIFPELSPIATPDPQVDPSPRGSDGGISWATAALAGVDRSSAFMQGPFQSARESASWPLRPFPQTVSDGHAYGYPSQGAPAAPPACVVADGQQKPHVAASVGAASVEERAKNKALELSANSEFMDQDSDGEECTLSQSLRHSGA